MAFRIKPKWLIVAFVISLFCISLLIRSCRGSTTATPAQSESAQRFDLAIRRAETKAVNTAREKLANRDLRIGGASLIKIGEAVIGSTAAAPASISPAGAFLVDGVEVPIDESQRALLLKYRELVLAIGALGLAVDLKGADLAGDALKQSVSDIFTGKPDEIEKRFQARSEQLTAQSRRACAFLAPLLATQKALAGSLDAFLPYATLAESDVEDCMLNDQVRVSNVMLGFGPDLSKSIDQLKRMGSTATEFVGTPERASAGNHEASAGGSGQNATVVNGIRFVLPAGDMELGDDSGHATITHSSGLRVKFADDGLFVNGERFAMPRKGQTVDLSTPDTVKIAGAKAKPVTR